LGQSGVDREFSSFTVYGWGLWGQVYVQERPLNWDKVVGIENFLVPDIVGALVRLYHTAMLQKMPVFTV